MTAVVTRLWPLVLTAGTVYAVWLLLRRHAFTTGDQLNGYILIYIGVAYIVAVTFLLLFTQRWTFRGIGQLCTALGDAVLYFGTGLLSLGWREGPRTAGELNLIRSLFIVGGTLLMAGLGWWAVTTRGGRRAWPPTDPDETLPEGVIPRRRATDYPEVRA